MRIIRLQGTKHWGVRVYITKIIHKNFINESFSNEILYLCLDVYLHVQVGR